MKRLKRLLWTFALSNLILIVTVSAQYPMPAKIPIWDANTVTLTLQKITDNVYAVLPSTVDKETTKGIPQATTGGIVIGDKGVLLIETMLNKDLFMQMQKLVKTVTSKPIIYAVNTSDHGDHCFGNFLLPKETIIIQNEFCKENLTKNFESIRQFMEMLFGKGRGIEEVKFRAADVTVSKYGTLKLDLGGIVVDMMNIGTAQSPADLFVYVHTPAKNILWGGNPFIGESPTIPWLFDGYFLEPVENLKKVYSMIGDNDVVVPGHGRITNKAGLQFTIDYVNALKVNVEDAVAKGLSLEDAKKAVTMKEFDKGYEIFNWLHYNFNLVNAYKDIKANLPKSTGSSR
jgi:glyoxylase-like metal-dependent hydrolase (beta-lactamase superfamily II)